MKRLSLMTLGFFTALSLGLSTAAFAECACSAGKTNPPANQTVQSPINQASVQNFASNSHNTTNQTPPKASADHQTQTNDATTAVKNT